uniref:Uncharacterized protein n=1 Tax=Anguilla anguilla TaxID=7936 RepID=A0A0E9Q3Q7_ANGAN
MFERKVIFFILSGNTNERLFLSILAVSRFKATGMLQRNVVMKHSVLLEKEQQQQLMDVSIAFHLTLT